MTNKNALTKNQSISKKDWNRASYGTRLMEVLQDSFDADEISNCLKEMMTAVVVTKGGNERPDYRTRERALTLYLEYIVGKPVQRQETVSYNYDINDLDENGLIETMANSPAVLSKVLEMVNQAKEMAMQIEASRN